MPRFRKKPVVIEAVRWWGDNIAEVDALTGQKIVFRGAGSALMVKTLEGVMQANLGDWIIKGVAGELYPCKPDIFEATYEAVDLIPLPDEPCTSDCRECETAGRCLMSG